MVDSCEPIQFPTVDSVKPIDLPATTPIKQIGDEPSTIAKATSVEEQSFSLTKPELPPPRSSPLWQLAEIFSKWEDLEGDLMEINGERIKQHLEEIKALSKEEALQMQKAIEQSKEVSFWGMLQDAASYVLGGISTVLGFTVIESGAPIVGGAMIASGVLSVSNTFMKHVKAWEWISKQVAPENPELQNQIQTYIPAALGITATVLGLAGSAGAWYYSHLGKISQVLAITQTATALIEGVTATGKGISDSRLAFLNSKTSFLQSKSRLIKILLENGMEAMQELSQQQTQMIQIITDILRTIKSAVQFTQQIV